MAKFTDPREEPLFVATGNDDPQMLRAYALAAETMATFREHVLRAGDHMCCAKLRFRDPDESEKRGEDALLYIWLNGVTYDVEEDMFSGTFFELPPEMTQWHQVGERLGFEADDVFDWMVNDDGHLYGGLTLRVVRERLPEDERPDYDEFLGVASWDPGPPPD